MRHHAGPLLVLGLLIDELVLTKALRLSDLMNILTLQTLASPQKVEGNSGGGVGVWALRLSPGPYCPSVHAEMVPREPCLGACGGDPRCGSGLAYETPQHLSICCWWGCLPPIMSLHPLWLTLHYSFL